MLVTVPVTEKHIEEGIPGDRWHCPIAKAMWEVTGVKWLVGATIFPLQDLEVRLVLPSQVVEFIIDFDKFRRPPRPFQFEMNIPLQFLAPGYPHAHEQAPQPHVP